MFPSKRGGATSPPTPHQSEPDHDNDSVSFLPMDLLTLSDRKPSLVDSDLASLQEG